MPLLCSPDCHRRVLTESLVTVQQTAAGTYLESGGQVVLEAENFGERINGPTHQWNLLTGQAGTFGRHLLFAGDTRCGHAVPNQ